MFFLLPFFFVSVIPHTCMWTVWWERHHNVGQKAPAQKSGNLDANSGCTPALKWYLESYCLSLSLSFPICAWGWDWGLGLRAFWFHGHEQLLPCQQPAWPCRSRGSQGWWRGATSETQSFLWKIPRTPPPGFSSFTAWRKMWSDYTYHKAQQLKEFYIYMIPFKYLG